MSISKTNVASYFSAGDLIESENVENPIRISAINDEHVQIEVASSDSIQVTYEALSSAVNALSIGKNETDEPLYRLANAYLERHEEAIDAMWRRAGACQLP